MRSQSDRAHNALNSSPNKQSQGSKLAGKGQKGKGSSSQRDSLGRLKKHTSSARVLKQSESNSSLNDQKLMASRGPRGSMYINNDSSSMDKQKK